MEEKGQQGKDRVSPASISALPLHGDGLVAANQMDKPLSPKDERNPPPNTSAISNQSEGLNANPVNPSNIFAPPEQTYFYGGYDDGSTNWGGDYSNYINPNNLQIVPPAIYSDNTSLLFHPAYGFDYSQFSPIAGPMSPIMIDGQLFSPHQVPMSPSYYSQPVSPNLSHVTSPPPSANTGQEGIGDNNVFLAPGSGYYLHYGSFGGNNSNGNNNGVGFYNGEVVMSSDNSYVSPLTSGGLYPAPGGILGSYEHIFSQQNAYGYGSVSGSGSSTRRGSFRGYNGNDSIYQGDRFMPEKGGKNRDRDGTINEPQSDRNNRGPRALKAKGDQISSPDSDLYNQPDFVTEYENAKFFVIKSFSEDNVHKSIKYGVWASTPLGNRKLDAAFQQAKEGPTDCPVFLFFSVNASGQFCGVAEMVGPVDFVNDAEYWQQEDRWSGQFRVKWHIIKDVPNSRFRHILLENNDNKPVTHSRDSQEVKIEAGMTMLKIFKDHDTDTSILDDFSYYDDREKDLQEKRTKEREITKNTPTDITSITQLTDKVESLHVDEKREEEEVQ